MKLARLLAVSLACTLLIGWLPLTAAQEEDLTTVTLPTLALEIGESASLDAAIVCAAEGGCSAFDIALAFDPAVIQIDSAAVGPYLGDQIFTVENTVDNDAGTLHLAAVVLGDMPEPASDILFTLAITARAAGTSPITFTHLDIADAVGFPASAEGIAGEIAVTREPEPCTVSTDEPYVDVRVGPGENRGVRASLPQNQDILVVGQAEDESGTLWWKIQPPNYDPAEADRYWVAADDVEETGDCALVGDANASELIFGTVATGEPGVSPVITNIALSGDCADFTLTFSWRDPDGNAVRIEQLYRENYTVRMSRSISGSAGTLVWPSWFCTADWCSSPYRIVDADGNSSIMDSPRIYCD